MYVLMAYIKDPNDLRKLKELLQKCTWKQPWKYYLFTSWRSLLKHGKEHPEDLQLVLIDIQEDTAEAIRKAKEVLKEEPHLKLIFSGPRDTDIPKLYVLDHLYFICRPFSRENLDAAIKKAHWVFRKGLPELLHVVNQKGIHSVPKDSITFLEKDRRMVHVHTTEERLSFYGRFSDMESSLDARFCQCHQSYIVNLYQVRELLLDAFLLKTGERIPITKKRRSEVWAHYERFIDMKPYWQRESEKKQK